MLDSDLKKLLISHQPIKFLLFDLMRFFVQYSFLLQV